MGIKRPERGAGHACASDAGLRTGRRCISLYLFYHAMRWLLRLLVGLNGFGFKAGECSSLRLRGQSSCLPIEFYIATDKRRVESFRYVRCMYRDRLAWQVCSTEGLPPLRRLVCVCVCVCVSYCSCCSILPRCQKTKQTGSPSAVTSLPDPALL
jgi:hypothetical protein